MVYQIMFYGGLVLAIICIIVAIIVFNRLNMKKVIGDLTGANARIALKEIEKQHNEGKQKVNTKDSGGDTSLSQRIRDLEESEELRSKRYENAKNRSKQHFKGNGVYRNHALGDKTQIFKLENETEEIAETGFVVLEEATSLLKEEIGTNVLISEEEHPGSGILDGLPDDSDATDVLVDESTDVLYQDESTDILTDDTDVTDILEDDESTSVLFGGNDEETSVLFDETTSVLTGDETTLLGDNSDVFVSVEDTVVDHTNERL